MTCLHAVWAMALLVFLFSLHACGGGSSGGSGSGTTSPATLNQSNPAEVQEITARLAELRSAMNLGPDLTVQTVDGFFISDPQYGTSGGHTRAEDVASIPAIFGPGGTNTHGQLLDLRNVRLVSDITSDYYSSRRITRAFILNYDFIYENGDIVTGSNVTMGRETQSGLWKFIGDPDQNNSGNTSNYGGYFSTYYHGWSSGFHTLDDLDEPVDVVSDGTDFYVVSSFFCKITKMDVSTGTSSMYAGTGGSGNINGIGTAASFNHPQGITTDGTNFYVADGNDRIRKIAISTGEVTALADAPGLTGFFAGSWTEERFSKTRSIATDGTNLFYIVYPGNDEIRKIVMSTGEVTTLAEAGSMGEWVNLQGIATDGTNLYVTDGSKKTIHKIEIATEAVTTLAGTPYYTWTEDGIGPAAHFYSPSHIATDGMNLYVADDTTILKIEISTGAVTTLAGAPWLPGSSDGTGTAARFNNPRSLTTDGTNVYVIDGNKALRKVEISTGVVTTY